MESPSLAQRIDRLEIMVREIHHLLFGLKPDSPIIAPLVSSNTGPSIIVPSINVLPNSISSDIGPSTIVLPNNVSSTMAPSIIVPPNNVDSKITISDVDDSNLVSQNLVCPNNVSFNNVSFSTNIVVIENVSSNDSSTDVVSTNVILMRNASNVYLFMGTEFNNCVFERIFGPRPPPEPPPKIYDTSRM